MSRLSRKYRTDIEYVSTGGVLDLFDNAVKNIFRMNNAEYDYFCQNASQEEMDTTMGMRQTFSEAKETLRIIDKYVKECYEQEEQQNNTDR